MDMDKKPLRPNSKRGGSGRSIKNVGFLALIVLIVLISWAAYRQQPTLTEIPISQAIQQANAGDYSKITLNGDEMDITKKGESQATLKTYKEDGVSLRTEGLNFNKVQVTVKPASSAGEVSR